MHINNHDTQFRVRSINRKVSNNSSLARSQSFKDRKLSLTHHFKNQSKGMDYLQVPLVYSPILESKKKESKRIIPKKLHISPALVIKESVDKENKAAEEPLFQTISFNQVTYKQLLKRTYDDEEEESCNFSYGYWPMEGRMVFIKSIKVPESKSFEESVNSLSHKGIVQYFGVEVVKEELCFFSEFIECGNLQEFIEQSGEHFNEGLIRNFAKQLVETVRYIHEKGYTHGSIKSSKILLGHNGELKLSLISAMAEEPITADSNIKKILWSAPERILRQKSEMAGDIWSIGMVVLELATRKKPWCSRAPELFVNTADLMRIIQTYQTPRLPLDRSSDLTDFLSMCLKFNPEDRSTIQELSEAKFLTQL